MERVGGRWVHEWVVRPLSLPRAMPTGSTAGPTLDPPPLSPLFYIAIFLNQFFKIFLPLHLSPPGLFDPLPAGTLRGGGRAPSLTEGP